MYTLMLVLHVLGATVWTGGHLVLSLVVLPRAVREREPRVIRDFESGFERIGLPALVVQVASGLWLAHRLAPDVATWIAFEDHVGAHIGAKLVLLALTVALAVHARLRVIPRLDADRLTVLAWHVVPVTVLSVLFVIVGVGIRTGF